MWTKKWAYIGILWGAFWVGLFIVCAIWNGCWHDRAPAGAPMSEKAEDDDKYYTSEIVASTIRVEVGHRDELIEGRAPEGTSGDSAKGYNRYDYRRDVHTKSHGCVLANFTVDDHVPGPFRYGVFSAPGPSRKAIIRFSSGQPDIEPDKTAWSSFLPLPRDVRGMAMKVLDVDGKKLLDDRDHGVDDRTQDFIATTSPVFFIRTVEQYSQFSMAFSRVDRGEIRRYLAYFIPHWYPSSWHVYQALLLAKSLKPVPDSLVRETYYSGSAYRLGPTGYVKFRMRPCDANIKPLPPGKDQKGAHFDYLRLELENQAKDGNACFNFEVQPQLLGKNMPVEDTTVEWSERDSPFQKIATIKIYRQSNTNKEQMNERCENLEFNPWHTVEDFQPVGVMNRLRRVVYQQMADFRRKKNCEARCRTACPGAIPACVEQCPLLNDPVPDNPIPVGCPVQTAASNPGK